MKPTLGTFVEIGVENLNDDIEFIVSEVFRRIEELSNRLNFHSESSELSMLNKANGTFLKMNRDSVNVIKLAKAIGLASENKFNCTIGNALGYFSVESCKYGSSSQIEIKGNFVRVPSGIKIILDGIAKGFAVDLAVNLLKKSGVKSGWVNAGGDIKVFGNFEIPIIIRDVKGQGKGFIKLKNAAIATSFLSKEKDESRYSSRYLGEIGIDLVSVVSNSAWRADALTKVAANTNEADRYSIITKLGGQLIDLNRGAVI